MNKSKDFSQPMELHFPCCLSIEELRQNLFRFSSSEVSPDSHGFSQQALLVLSREWMGLGEYGGMRLLFSIRTGYEMDHSLIPDLKHQQEP